MARIYVAGPYSAPTYAERLANVGEAMGVFLKLLELGHAPFCPHLSHFLDEAATHLGRPVSYEQWLAYDLVWVKQCEALYLIAPSPGALREVEYALSQGITVFTSISLLEAALF